MLNIVPNLRTLIISTFLLSWKKNTCLYACQKLFAMNLIHCIFYFTIWVFLYVFVYFSIFSWNLILMCHFYYASIKIFLFNMILTIHQNFRNKITSQSMKKLFFEKVKKYFYRLFLFWKLLFNIFGFSLTGWVDKYNL